MVGGKEGEKTRRDRDCGRMSDIATWVAGGGDGKRDGPAMGTVGE